MDRAPTGQRTCRWSVSFELLARCRQCANLFKAFLILLVISIAHRFNGKQKYTGSRGYFFADLNGKAPSNWLVHGTLGELVMGSWSGNNHVLCRAPVSIEEDEPEVLDAPAEEGGQGFTVSLTKGSNHDDHEAICVSDFGESATVADWTDDLAEMSSDELSAMMVDQGIKKGSGGYWINEKGKAKFSGDRAFFFEDHDGSCPSNWLVHGKKDDLCLGSWHGTKYVLCKTTAVKPSDVGEGEGEDGDDEEDAAGSETEAEVENDESSGDEDGTGDGDEDEGGSGDGTDGTGDEDQGEGDDEPGTRNLPPPDVTAVTGDPQ